MKIVILGDLHFGVRGGDQNFLEFQKGWFEEILFPYMTDNDIDTIIQCGDLFDNRQYMKLNVMHEMIKWFIPAIRDMKINWFSIAGNHDCYYRDNNHIHSQSLLGAVQPTMVTISKSVTEIDFEGKKIAFVPWINKNNQKDILSKLDKSTANYVVGHFELTGFPMYKGVLSTHGMETSFLDKFDKVISGHYHTVSQHKNIQYVGTPYHLTWSDVIDGNNRGFWVLDTEKDTIEMINNPDWATMFSVIEYDPDTKYDETYFDAFVGNISKIVINEVKDEKHKKKFLEFVSKAKFLDYKTIDNTSIKVQSVDIKIEASGDTKSLTENIDSFIELQETSVDLENVKELARVVYLEAINGK